MSFIICHFLSVLPFFLMVPDVQKCWKLMKVSRENLAFVASESGDVLRLL